MHINVNIICNYNLNLRFITVNVRHTSVDRVTD